MGQKPFYAKDCFISHQKDKQGEYNVLFRNNQAKASTSPPGPR